jgi:hypothetical protein
MFIGALVAVNAHEPQYLQIYLAFLVLVHEPLKLGALIQLKSLCITLDYCYYLPFQLLSLGLQVGRYWQLVFSA